MKDLRIKVRLIFLPFLVITVGFMLVYTLLDWLLFIKVDSSLSEDITQFVIPLIAAWIPLLIWLRPKIKLLNFKKKTSKDPVAGYLFLAWMAMLAPTLIAQRYLSTASGRLTALTNVNGIRKSPPTKYYELKEHFISKEEKTLNFDAHVSGKNNQYLDFSLYIACPIYASQIQPVPAPDSIAHVKHTDDAVLIKPKEVVNRRLPKAWLCVNYKKEISNRLEAEEKKKIAEAFYETSLDKFDTTDLEHFVYLDRIGNSSNRKGYLQAIRDIFPGTPANSFIILEPRNNSFAERSGTSSPWIFGSLAIGAAVWLLLLLFPSLKRTEEVQQAEIASDLNRDLSKEEPSWKFFLPQEGFFVTPIIIYINVLVFVLMIFAGKGFITFQTRDLLQWGANFRPYTTNGQWWRLLSAAFLHGGLMHLFLNMYGLMFAGVFLERILGRKRFVTAYIGTALIASLASIAWYPATVSVGASGAIFGMYGIFVALLTSNLFPTEIRKPFLINIVIFIGINLLYGLAGGIDNAAHIGGLVSGIVWGYALVPSLRLRSQES